LDCLLVVIAPVIELDPAWLAIWANARA